MRFFKTFLLASILSFFSCDPIIVKVITKMDELKSYESFVVFKENEKFDLKGIEVGDIEIQDVTLIGENCTYDNVIRIATEKARKMGANCLRIYEHILPGSGGNKCHHIKGKAYKIDDITSYEKVIIWHEDRKLTKKDYKGSIENRPFDATTFSGIRYKTIGHINPDTLILLVETYFDCEKSYFKDSTDTVFTIEHEQCHFDISELYARIFIKRLEESKFTAQEMNQQIKDIYNQLKKELLITQDKYDYEVYPNRAKQKEWLLKIHHDLDSLNDYKSKAINLQYSQGR